MSQGQTGMTQEEMNAFAEKLQQFRASLNESEQRVFTALIKQAQSATGDVRGYDDGGPGNSPSLDLSNFPFTTVLSNPTIAPNLQNSYSNRLDRTGNQ